MSITFNWTKDMSVGESVIDAQHQKLLKQVNKIIEAVVYGADSEQVRDALAFFDSYVKEHLAYEEKYMKEQGYPDYAEHEKKHQAFIDSYTEFKNEFARGTDQEKLVLEIEKFLGSWWTEHIGHEDKKYYVHIAHRTT